MVKGKTVYICSPLAADTPEGIRTNMMQARKYMKEVSKHLQCRGIAPHAWLPEFLEDSVPEERILALSFGESLLYRCDALIICGGRISAGMKGEIKKARELGKPVYQWFRTKRGCGIIEVDGTKEETDEVQVQKKNIS